MMSRSAFIDNILVQSTVGRDALLHNPTVGRFVDASLPVPQPFLGTGDIRLVIIGQDPTIQQKESRSKVTTALNLERGGPLRTYLSKICSGLGLVLEQHVYATNAVKCFFLEPPTKIKEDYGIDVLEANADIWLPILKHELTQFPDATVISLGQPVLSMLVHEGRSRQLKTYWGYHRDWQQGRREALSEISSINSRLERRIFPFVHLSTKAPLFYKEMLDHYLAYVRQRTNESSGNESIS